MKNYRFAIGIMTGFIFGTFQASLLTADEIEATVTVSQKAPTAHADMGESKVNDGTIRSFTVDPIFDPEKEALDPESVSFSSGGDAAWFHQAGSLTAVEIPTLDSCGDFGVMIKGTIVAKKVEDKSQGSGTSSGGYTFTGSGSYGIAKCTQPFKADTSKTDWNPAGKNLVGYPCVPSYQTISCPVIQSKTWQDVWNAIPNPIGYFICTKPQVMNAKSYGKNNRCPVCKMLSYNEEIFLLDFTFKPMRIRLVNWQEASLAGTQTIAQWNIFFGYEKTHEGQHQEDFKNNVLTAVYPIQLHYQCCRNCTPLEYLKIQETIDIKKRVMHKEATQIVNQAMDVYNKLGLARDLEAKSKIKSWAIYGSTPVTQ